MEKYITFENLRNFAYCNSHLLKQPIKAVVVYMFGWGDIRMYNTEEDVENGPLVGEVMSRWGAEGILYLVPYYNPWSWMNQQAVAYVDEVMDVVYREFDISEDVPIAYVGGSMGGLSALAYTAFSKRKPVACITSCPASDLTKFFWEMPRYQRSIYSAFHTYEGTLEEAMRSVSPIYITDKLPTDTEYVIFHTEGDPTININSHADVLYEKMKDTHNVTYYRVPGGGHCEMPDAWWERFLSHLDKAVGYGK